MSQNSLKTDAEIVTQLRIGNPDGVKAIYEKAFYYCAAYITKRGGTLDNARDVFQEVLIVFLKKVQEEGFEIKINLKSYLYAITKNIWRTQLRKQQQKPTVPIESQFDLAEENSALNEKQEKEEQLEKMEAAFAYLKEDCQKVLKLFFYQKMRSKEVAKALGLSLIHI